MDRRARLNKRIVFKIIFNVIESPNSLDLRDRIETHLVPELNASIRLQEYGVGIFSVLSTKSALKKALKKQYITINGEVVSTATFINGGETIKLTIPEQVSQKKKLKLKLKVLFEDEYLALISKPSGILVSGNNFKTIANALAQNLKPSLLKNATKPQPVHRLDYATTGILLIGKTSDSIRTLNQLFETKKITKTYYAVTIGCMKPPGIINTKIDEKEACSEYRVYDSVVSKRFDSLNLVQLNPKTGRRHQLRKHLASIGNPILGDVDYGLENLILKRKGMYLHAFSLEFIHPFTEKKIYLKDEFPKKYGKLFSTIKQNYDSH